MSSLARYLRDRAADDIRQMTAAGRILLALRLGEDDLALFCAAQAIDKSEAQRRLRAERQRGRRLSRSATP